MSLWKPKKDQKEKTPKFPSKSQIASQQEAILLGEGDKQLPVEDNGGSNYKFPETTPKQEINAAGVQTIPKNGSKPKTTSTFLPTYKPIIPTKLTILFIENTLQVAKENGSLTQIVKGLVKEGLVCFINYGSIVQQTGLLQSSAIQIIPILVNEELSEKACLYDALIHLANLVTQKYLSVEERDANKVKIDSIDIIGIGTCFDNASAVQKEFAINCFAKATEKPQILSKYFCLTEQGFMEAAQIGFRSIGAISRNY